MLISASCASNLSLVQEALLQQAQSEWDCAQTPVFNEVAILPSFRSFELWVPCMQEIDLELESTAVIMNAVLTTLQRVRKA